MNWLKGAIIGIQKEKYEDREFSLNSNHNTTRTNGNTSHSSKTGNRFLKVETKKKNPKN